MLILCPFFTEVLSILGGKNSILASAIPSTSFTQRLVAIVLLLIVFHIIYAYNGIIIHNMKNDE